jgi:hypothetical protein
LIILKIIQLFLGLWPTLACAIPLNLCSKPFKGKRGKRSLVFYKVTITYFCGSRSEERWAISREYKNKIIIAASVKGLKEYAILISIC